MGAVALVGKQGNAFLYARANPPAAAQ